jgi:DNA-binding transcriptional LysR family regulator
MLDWDDLKFFSALAEQGSLSAAARVLRVDHATVARRIAALEDRLGAKLVDRRARSYRLTEDGHRAAAMAREMANLAFRIERSLGEEDRAPQLVSVSAPPVLLRAFVAPRVAEFARTHPHITLQLLSQTQTVSLARREADVAIRLVKPTNAELVIRKVGTIRTRLYASPAYLAAKSPQEFGFIAFDEAQDDLLLQKWILDIAAGRPIVLRANDMHVQWRAALGDAGVVALLDAAAAETGLVEADPEGRFLDREIWITYHQDLRGVASIAAVVTFLAACMPPRP